MNWNPSRPARSALVWGIRYGLPGAAIRYAARRGDPVAKVIADPEVLADPFAAYDRLRARGPVVANRMVSATASHAVVNSVLRDEHFLAGPTPAPTNWLSRVAAAAVDPAALGPGEPPSLLAIHPPQHTRLRGLVSRAFTPRAVAAYSERIREIADELLDDIARGPATFDLIDTYAALLPVTVIAEIIGVPVTNRAQFLDWGAKAAMSLDPGMTWREYRVADRAIRDIHTWLGTHIADLRRDPGPDMLSRLVRLDELTDVELKSTAQLLLGAGFETTVKLIGNAVALLLRHPDQLGALLADASGWDKAVEEVLRFDTPVQMTLRTAHTDTEHVPAGQSLIVLLGGANRDPAVFDDPHRFDITRANAREHLAFSAGVHYCLGAQLARMETVIALRALFERFPNLAAAGTPVRGGTRVLRGYRHLPLRTGKVGLRAVEQDQLAG
ncbi:putative cytochrome P450 hydroxylase [Alloactinosynnema sp. L-07]|uniref:cytochrome P450 n=1 Tax=Alloactinosynnema sp. L-07 TaxID=1653480 RepID=UPI00065F0668|nr:cytochrome P450 [Alloactinosynnema sp. L-07]CRK55355.1 putative cytochrome P450 hydroxylase [Alloactinosynnema sp. L-07]